MPQLMVRVTIFFFLEASIWVELSLQKKNGAHARLSLQSPESVALRALKACPRHEPTSEPCGLGSPALKMLGLCTDLVRGFIGLVA